MQMMNNFFTSPGEIAFRIGNFEIYWYGILMSCSMLLGLTVILTIAKKFFKDISTNDICDLAFFLIIVGIISARLYYVVLDFDYFIKNPFEITAIWNGGISIQGAVIGCIIAGYYYTKINGLNFLRYADLFSFGLVCGQILGRWGNFFNSEAFGLPCNLPWALYIPYKNRPFEYRDYDLFHPAFLYESILNIFVFIFLLYLLKKFGDTRKNGIIFCSYIILYSIVRLLVETIRIDSVLNISSFHVAHIVSFLFIIIFSFILRKILKET